MKQSLLAILAGVLLAGPVAAGATIDLQAEATVSGSIVRLSDIALVDGDATGDLRNQGLCPAPSGGETLTLTQTKIRRRLLALLGDSDFTLRGPAECRIRRVAAETAAPPTVAGPAGSAARPVAALPPSTGQTLQAQLARFIADKMGRAEDRVRIDFEPQNALDLATNDLAQTFQFFTGPGDLTVGEGNIRVEVRKRAAPQLISRTLYVRFRTATLDDVVVAGRDVKAGEILNPEDVHVERREFRTDVSACLHDAADAVGATAKAALQEGQVLKLSDLLKTLMVRRGDTVTVEILGRGFTMKTVSRALESGEVGSTIAVQGKDGKGKFYAQVTGPRTLELRLASPGVMAADGAKVAVKDGGPMKAGPALLSQPASKGEY
jgi:flagella basal body P-ring formation protein FlgA